MVQLGGVWVQTYLSVSVRQQGRSIVVELDGELDLGSSRQFEQAIENVWRTEPELVVIDVGRLSFADMAGLRALLMAQDQAEHEGTELLFANVRDPVRRVMRLASVNGLFRILEDDA